MSSRSLNTFGQTGSLPALTWQRMVGYMRPTNENPDGGGSARSEPALRLAPILRGLQRDSEKPHALYYLGCVPAGKADRQAELALALTALGWPAGTLVLLPFTPGWPGMALAHGLDRLRWLFAGSFDIGLL